MNYINNKFFILLTVLFNLPAGVADNDLGNFAGDLYFASFELFFILTIVVFLLFFVVLSNKRLNDQYLNVSNSFLNLLLFSLLLSLIILNNSIDSSYCLFGGFYYSDPFITFLKNIMLLGFIFFLFILKAYLSWFKRYDFEFLVILLISIFSSMLLINSNNLLALFFIIELQSLTFYILVSSRQSSSLSTEAGLKYFILGCFSSGIILFGISLIYGFTGFLTYTDLSIYSSALYYNYTPLLLSRAWSVSSNGFIAGLLFLTIGLLFKLGSVPFHMWMPDVYEGAPLIITAYLSTIPKIALVFIFFKLYYSVFFNLFFVFHSVFLLSAILSIALGSIAAIYQVKLKRLLTYSMITNTGYLLLGLSLGEVSGIFSTLFYVLTYVFIMLGLFCIFISLRDRVTGVLIKKVTFVVNLFEINPPLAFSLFVLLFSIAGMPPLLGFYGKFVLFMFALKLEIFLVSIIFVVFSTISVFYYIRLVKLSYFNRSTSWVFFEEMPFINSFLISLTVMLNCLFFINPNLFFKLVYNFSFLIFL